MNTKENLHAVLKGVNEDQAAMSIIRHLIVRSLFAIAVSGLLALTPASAQLVADGGSATLNNVTNTITGNVGVGTNGSFTTLILTNNALLTNTLDGFIGLGFGANNNTVSLDGPNARWYLRDLIIGSNGSFNRISVSNGSVVQSRAGYLGYDSVSGGNNSALVTGAGSVWSNQTDLFVGFGNLGNQLVVSNGGVVVDGTGYVGFNSSSAQNAVVVTGAGSLWSNRTDFRVGQASGGNTLLITNGGTVFGLDGGYLGFSNASFNNRITTDGGTLRVANAAGTGVFGIRRGTNVLNAGTNDVDQLVMTNGAGFFEFNGGTLITRGGTISNFQNFRVGENAGYGPATWDVRTTNGAVTVVANNLDIGFNAGNATLLLTNGATLSVGTGIGFSQTRLGANFSSSNNLALISGANSLWTNAGDLFVGYQGGFGGGNNTLIVSNGARVANSNGVLGSFFGVNGNQATVTGANSAWVNSGGLIIGDGGTGNTLLVASGGTVANEGGVIGGSFGGPTSNQVIVTGAGSLWTNRSDLVVGSNGAFNTLLIASGGRVADDFGLIGYNSSANNNQVTVSGTGSVWDNGIVIVGIGGSFNTMLISNGGTAASGDFGVIGYGPGASYNQVTVTGTNSAWTNVGIVVIGADNGTVNNQLNVLNGGTVFSAAGAIGYQSAGATGNSAIISGAGSLWSNGGVLLVGDTGSGNTLFVTNGGTVADTFGIVGNQTGANSNRATVTGTGSLWTNSGHLYVGSNGAFNTLVISNGGTVANGYAYLGYRAGASNNAVTITGPGATWNNNGNLYVGLSGSGNALLITNGGKVAGYLGSIGENANASNNQVTVTGTNSVWNNGGNLIIGDDNGAVNNQLNILNGGTVVSFSGQIGSFSPGASSNSATVSGAGSLWANSSDLLVGDTGSGNTLLITNGGTVANFMGVIGNSFGSSNNQVTVTGTNSVWSSGYVIVGDANGAVNNQLNILNGGTVVSTSGKIGSFAAGASGNSATINGAGSLWTNSGDLLVGDTGSSNILRITNGGAVLSGGTYVGYTTTSTNNLLTVGNATLTVTNATSDAVLDVRRGGAVFTGGTITADQLLLTNGGGTFTFNAGTLITRTATISNGRDFLVGSNAGFAPATWDVRSNATPTVLSKGLFIGSSNANATLLITNGATLSVGLADGYTSSVLGASAGSTNNLAIVAGDNSVWTNSGDLYLGSNGAFNVLLITNGGRVVNSNAIIGYRVGASNSQVIVSGGSSTWTNRGALSVGFSSAFNALLITNGATVSDVGTVIGLESTANNNRVTVTGTNSILTSSGFLRVGTGGSSNTLLIANGGRVFSPDGYIGYDSTAKNNQIAVTGGGSMWANSGDVHLGESSSGNLLLISNGGWVGNQSAFIGYYPDANNNQVTVTGGGSTWTNSGDVYVGYFGSSNTLLITNGGTAQAANAYVGATAYASNSLLTVGNGTLTVTNPTSNAVLDVRYGRAVFNGGTITADRLLLTSTNGTFTFNAGTLITRTATISNGLDFVVGASAGLAPATWDVRSNAVPTVLSKRLFIGTSNANATLLITNGATLSVAGDNNYLDASILGLNAGSTNNLAVVAGPNSVWTNNYGLSVGESGSFSTLLITNGGRVANAEGYVGAGSTASNNQVTVTGPGSLWTNSSALFVGNSGSFNTLLITNGGAVVSGAGFIGNNAGASKNQVTVTDPSSLWTNSGALFVGYASSFNTLLITNGGRVANTSGYLGVNPGANNNQVTVTGSNSLWTTSNDLDVGYFGSLNTLLITNGGAVQAAYANVGFNAGSTNNLLTVGNATLTVTNASVTGVLDVRRGSAVFNGGNITADQLLLTNGGGTFTFNVGTLITRTATINNGLDFVVGAGAGLAPATWDVRSNATPTVLANALFIGSNAANATLLITNGATLSVGLGTNGITSSRLGVNAGSKNNLAVVAGPGSLWTNRNELSVGYFGAFNTLLISNAGRVADGFGFIGYNSTATNNQVTVTGTNSVWSHTNQFYIGLYGSGNSLFITNGGQVASVWSYFGNQSGANNNQVTVSGSNSMWTTIASLSIGVSGANNTLLINDGGLVADRGGYLGYQPDGNNNQVTVTGSNSKWANSNELNVGYGGSFNVLLITNGGTAASTYGFVGANSGASNNQVIVTGSNSVWTNSNDLDVGYSGSSNALFITNGGAVLAANAYVGFNSSSSNNLLRLDNGTLTVTNYGSGQFDVRRGTVILNGGTITTDQLLANNGASSVFTFNAGTLNVRYAGVGNGAPFTVGNGTSNALYRMTGGASDVHLFANGLVIASNATLAGNGNVIGAVTNFGTITPGNSAGSIRINGDLNLKSSSLMSFEIGGLIATNEYDQLTVAHFAQLAGNLSLALLPGYLPRAADIFTLVNFETTSGQFANAAPGGRVSLSNNLASFAVTYTLTNFSLGSVTYVDGDGDGQGDLQEIAAGTDPNSSASELTVTSITQNGSGFYVLTFQSVTGKNYRIEYSGNLTNGWSIATTNVPSAGASTTWIDDGTQTGGMFFFTPQRFYRVGLQ